jgi:hypothetical protein
MTIMTLNRRRREFTWISTCERLRQPKKSERVSQSGWRQLSDAEEGTDCPTAHHCGEP